MLVCVLLESVGIAARSVGVEFGRHPRLLPAVLAPLLDKLGDHDAAVRSRGIAFMHSRLTCARA